ncbi:MAG: nicotinate (nicotinamide) nucleotide adenylyltransferase [Candidatus Levybacteria bacterium]|nr:nicotinate (nicotinamide) nucleotide adenylyltransferase [Candidatus Levybacteria bacterium]
MNIAILGSSFDPPHNGHLKIARNILKTKKANKVILMPVNIHPFGKNLTLSSHRLQMTKFLQEKNIEVSELEINKNSVSFSVDTLKALQQKYPLDRFCWIIGSDQLISFNKWKEWQAILRDFGLIIFPRGTHVDVAQEIKKLMSEKQIGKNLIILNAKDFPHINISSSEIKQRVKSGKSISDLVPKKVEDYIMRNKLYK